MVSASRAPGLRSGDDTRSRQDRAKERFRELLKEQQSRITDHSKALECLAQQLDDLTIAGAMLPDAEGGTTSSPILWMTVEFGLDANRDVPKARRMYPLAVRYADQAAVEALHRRFFDSPTAWERETANWLTPSRLLDIACLLKKNGVLLGTHRTDRGRLTAVQQDLRTHDEDVVTAFLEGEELVIQCDTIPSGLRWKFDRIRFSGTSLRVDKFFEWLCSTSLPVGMYYAKDYSVQADHPTLHDARFYAALIPDAPSIAIIHSLAVAKIVHEDPVRGLIDKAVPPHPLDKFWNQTRDWFDVNSAKPHNSGDDPGFLATLFETLRPFLGKVPEPWKAGSSLDCFWEALKSLCGVTSLCNDARPANNVSNPLSVAGGYLCFLMGSYCQLDRLACKAEDIEKMLADAKRLEWAANSGRLRHAYLCRSRDTDTQRSIARLIFNLGGEFARHKTDPTRCPIGRPVILADGSGVVVQLNLGRSYASDLLTLCKDPLPLAGQQTGQVRTMLAELSRLLGPDGGQIHLNMPEVDSNFALLVLLPPSATSCRVRHE